MNKNAIGMTDVGSPGFIPVWHDLYNRSCRWHLHIVVGLSLRGVKTLRYKIARAYQG